jgi:serine protease SohB
VSFLVGGNSPSKKLFGSEPEVVLVLHSGGGEVTLFACAAAQVARLRTAGYQVTVCVDRIAASGGYMIASQATQIVAAPFAMVGSIGVITESLNFYNILKNYGIQSLVLKAGAQKNPLTLLGQVTEKDLKNTQNDLEETHRDFINLCTSSRPMLDPAVCNGKVFSGEKALESGLIDRILTSDDYLYEKINDGALVMKVHLITPTSERAVYAHVLQLLPHIRQKMHSALTSLFQGNTNVKFDVEFVSKIMQGVALASMIRRAVHRSRFS